MSISNPVFSTAPALSGGVPFESAELLPTTPVQGASTGTVQVVRTSGTVLTIASGASASAPQQVRFNPRTRTFTSSTTLTITAGTGSGAVAIYAQFTPSGPVLLVQDSSGNTFSGPFVQALPAPYPTPPVLLLYTWTITSGAFDLTGGTNRQIAKDIWLDSLILTNATASAATTTLTDGNSNPVLSATSVPANSSITLSFPGGVFLDSGFTMAAGTASAITAHFRGLLSN